MVGEFASMARCRRFALFRRGRGFYVNAQREPQSNENEPEGDCVAPFDGEGIEANAHPYNFEGNRIAFNLVEQTDNSLIDIPNFNLRVEGSAGEELNFSMEGVEE